MKQRILNIDSVKKEKMYDNFEALVKYSETLLRHDDPYIAKRRQEHSKTVSRRNKQNELRQKLAKLLQIEK